MKIKLLLSILLTCFVSVPLSWTEMSKNDINEANRTLRDGTYYLRIDLPCTYNRVGGLLVTYGVQVEPMAEVTTTGTNIDLSTPDLPPTVKTVLGKRRGSSRLCFVYGPNDPVKNLKASNAEGGVYVAAEGLPPRNDEVAVKLVNVSTMDQFKAAFDRTFSKVPLQDEHPEWPAEIRKAIAERRLVEGMTPEQAYCVTGRPWVKGTAEEGGAKVEMWQPRQEVCIGVRARDANRLLTQENIRGNFPGFPDTLKFTDGKLTNIGAIVTPDLKKK